MPVCLIPYAKAPCRTLWRQVSSILVKWFYKKYAGNNFRLVLGKNYFQSEMIQSELGNTLLFPSI